VDKTVLTGLTDGAPGPELEKAPTGILGLDQITGGGLPRGRVTLVAGIAGAGKTQLDAERAEIDRIDLRERHRAADTETDRSAMETRRWADTAVGNGEKR
jgi:replicative DNA helicase